MSRGKRRFPSAYPDCLTCGAAPGELFVSVEKINDKRSQDRRKKREIALAKARDFRDGEPNPILKEMEWQVYPYSDTYDNTVNAASFRFR